jgi:hypothetical protein
MRMMNWAALSVAAGMSSCSLMATTTLVARMAVPRAPATVSLRKAPVPLLAAHALSQSARRLA